MDWAFGMHAWHSTLPLGANSVREQFKQFRTDADRSLFDAVPVGQPVHAMFPISCLNLPAEHPSHNLDVFSKKPALHSQSDDVPYIFCEVENARHSMQSELPSGENWVSEQGKHPDAFVRFSTFE
tara:strand:- start:67785 stop:68159 length:375 start_codon:yes stop_codon:yes gene_type:complete